MTRHCSIVVGERFSCWHSGRADTLGVLVCILFASLRAERRLLFQSLDIAESPEMSSEQFTNIPEHIKPGGESPKLSKSLTMPHAPPAFLGKCSTDLNMFPQL